MKAPGKHPTKSAAEVAAEARRDGWNEDFTVWDPYPDIDARDILPPAHLGTPEGEWHVIGTQVDFQGTKWEYAVRQVIG